MFKSWLNKNAGQHWDTGGGAKLSNNSFDRPSRMKHALHSDQDYELTARSRMPRQRVVVCIALGDLGLGAAAEPTPDNRPVRFPRAH